MGKVKQIKIKNRTYYFYNDMISLKNFESNLLKIDKKHFKAIDIYYIGYITIKIIGEYENNHSVNPLHLLINEASGYIEEKDGNKYLISDDSVNENKVLLIIGMELKTKAINGGKENDYGKEN